MNADRDREPRGDAPAEPDQTTPPSRPSEGTAPDPGDEVPVPGAMAAAEIDERAQVVEALRREQRPGAEDSPPER